MKVGLVHGRFQPFHKGHKFLVDKMLKECDLGVVLIGSAQKNDNNNPYTLKQRLCMIREIYKNEKKLFIGANIDLDSPHSEDSPWDVVLSSCVLSLTGHLPTDIYAGIDYSVQWRRINIEINKHRRYNDISGTDIKKLIRQGRFTEVEDLVPKEVYKYLRETNPNKD
ncbi:hypothetical protein CMI47_18720 [Candidatus Pacearchaeota archaeon]|nr:hypothetical protein [Candidatus Pacearchaeota archaeon]|tara:strand:+ start:3200 stop:3700 length:501 start_codon:yes stop_codon:yes gene_type:complete